MLLDLGVKPEEIPDYKIMKSEGCSVCNGTGIKGRVALFELMTMTDTLREAILKKVTTVELKNAAIRGGMRTLRQSALLKLKTGLISVDEVAARDRERTVNDLPAPAVEIRERPRRVRLAHHGRFATGFTSQRPHDSREDRHAR